MAVEIRYLAHAAVELKSGDTTVLVDPFITGNPKITVEASELEPTHIFLTHGHQDHYGDTVEIAKRTGATVVAITEVAGEMRRGGRRERARPEPRRHGRRSTGAGSSSCPRGTPRRRPRARSRPPRGC